MANNNNNVMIKKRHPNFNVPNFGFKVRVKRRWRKQRGIDNKKRIKKSFMGAEPTIGYRNPEQIRGVRINGRKIILVNNIKELEAMADKGEDFDITIAKPVSARKRIAISELAQKKGLHVTNGVYK